MNTKRFAQGVFAALIIPGAVYLIFALLRPDVFWRADVVYLLFIQSIESIILGWGMSFGMISGNMDLSVAAETILGTIVAAIAAKSFGIPGLVVGALATNGSRLAQISGPEGYSYQLTGHQYCLLPAARRTGCGCCTE